MAKDTNAMTWHSQLLFELCRKTGRTAPSIKRDFYEKNNKYPYSVTVGNICGPMCETSTEAEIVAATNTNPAGGYYGSFQRNKKAKEFSLPP